jgi:uncharacterized protein YyaL (SSP411 family)
MDFLLSSPKEVAIVGKDAADIQPLLHETWRRYLPNKVVAPGFSGASDGIHTIPLLQSRSLVNGQATAYVCHNYTCKQPVTTPKALAAELQS